MAILLDTNFLVALADRGSEQHQQAFNSAKAVFQNDEKCVLPTVVLPETCYLIASKLGHHIMRRFISELRLDSVQVESVTVEDLQRIGELLEQYADNQLDFVDAAIVAIAERLNIARVYTFDRRDFSRIRPKHCDYFELFP